MRLPAKERTGTDLDIIAQLRHLLLPWGGLRFAPFACIISELGQTARVVS